MPIPPEKLTSVTWPLSEELQDEKKLDESPHSNEAGKVIDRDRQVVQSLASLILENDRHASIRLREARPRRTVIIERSHAGN